MKRIKQNSIYTGIVAISLAVAVVYLLFGLRYTKSPTFPYYLLTLFILFAANCIAMFFVDILHELGHIFFGLCCNFKILKMSLSSFNFDLTTGKVKFYLSNPFGKLAGESILLPKTDKSLKGKFICITCGGLIFTFCIVLLGILSFIFYKQLSFGVYLLCIAPLPYAVYQFLLNSVPLEIGGLHTDGKVLLDFIQGGNNAVMLQTLLAIESALVQGKSPKEIPEKLYNSTIVLADDNVYAILYKLQKYYRYLDEENIDRALEIALQLLQQEEYFPEEYREKILTEILFVLTVYTEEKIVEYLAESLEEYLQQDELLTVRTRLAILAKKEGFIKIEEQWKQAYSEAKGYSIAGISKFECKLLQSIQQEFSLN